MHLVLYARLFGILEYYTNKREPDKEVESECMNKNGQEKMLMRKKLQL
jgi:hypothetical protein